MSKEIPILYFNTSDEDRETYFLLLRFGIPVEFRPAASDGPGLDETPTKPLLRVGYQRFVGRSQIEKYLLEKYNPARLL